jgi:hypothetical protein
MKMHYFKDRISDSSFASIKSTIMMDHQKFQEFDAVLRLNVNCKRMQKAEAPTYQSHNVSVNIEVTAHAPILSNDTNYKEEWEDLEAHGPFVPSVLTDTKKVWFILLACFGASSAWQHVKKYDAQQNGRQAWRTLHNHFFGGDKINTMVSDILLTHKNLHYSGDCKNFNLNKYCTAHAKQRNCHAALAQYGVTPLEETMKIHYFKDRISDSSFASVKSTIMVVHQKFQEFDAVLRLYVNFKPTQKAEAPTFQFRNVSVDIEVTAHAPILSNDTNYEEEWEDLEAHGPFVPSVLTDTRRFGPFSLHVLVPQVCGNMSRV